MTSLLVLAVLLLAWWAWAVWERDGRASVMDQWLHVPFLAAVLSLVMAVGLWIRP